jgi:toxin ParE1/3/4
LPEYRLSNQARLDLRAIARYSFETWGIDQAHRYTDDLLKCFERIAGSPLIGRPCDRVRKGYRRMEHGRHVIFYRPDSDGLFIGRILHQRMLPNLRVIDNS